MSVAVEACIGLGANLGDRAATLRAAADELATHPMIDDVVMSEPIETEPVGPPQPRFLNAALTLRTTLEPCALLSVCHAIELRHGRDRRDGQRWGPRTLDLDLLLYGDRVIVEPGLTIPHPRMHVRRYVLGPLASIAPDLRHPILGRTIAELLDDARSGIPPGSAGFLS